MNDVKELVPRSTPREQRTHRMNFAVSTSPPPTSLSTTTTSTTTSSPTLSRPTNKKKSGDTKRRRPRPKRKLVNTIDALARDVAFWHMVRADESPQRELVVRPLSVKRIVRSDIALQVRCTSIESATASRARSPTTQERDQRVADAATALLARAAELFACRLVVLTLQETARARRQHVAVRCVCFRFCYLKNKWSRCVLHLLLLQPQHMRAAVARHAEFDLLGDLLTITPFERVVE